MYAYVLMLIFKKSYMPFHIKCVNFSLEYVQIAQ